MTESNTPNQNQEQNVLSDYLEGYQHLELQSAENNVRKARNAIFVIAGLILLSSLILMGASDSFTPFNIAFAMIASGIFVALGFLTKKQPLTSIIIALILFVGLWISDIVLVGPEYIIKGIIVKGAIVYFLVTGIKHAKEAERLRKELKHLQNKTE